MAGLSRNDLRALGAIGTMAVTGLVCVLLMTAMLHLARRRQRIERGRELTSRINHLSANRARNAP